MEMTNETSKILKVIIKQKFDDCTNWDMTYVPKAGETCWVHAPTLHKVIPIVGDGINPLSGLDPVYTKALDVEEWAKKSEAEFLAWTGLQTMIDTRIEQYLLNNEFLIDANDE